MFYTVPRKCYKGMRINEIAKNRSCTAIEKDPLHLLLEIGRVRLEWSWISIRTSGGRGRDSESVQAIWEMSKRWLCLADELTTARKSD